MAEEKLKKLKTNRASIKGSMTRFSSFLEDAKINPAKLGQLSSRLKTFEDLLNKFELVQTEIESFLDGADDVLETSGASENECRERSAFEDRYYQIIEEAASLSSPIQLNNSVNANIRVKHSNVKLPTVSLPKFSGERDCWVSFHDRFKSLIHDDSNLSISEKFFYLLSSLSGDALKYIEDIESTDSNYEVAWSMLREKYENKKKIIRSHIQKIVDIPPIAKENYNLLRQFLDTIEKNLRVLKTLNEPVEQWDTLLLYLLVEKLDKYTRKEWETKVNKVQAPTMNLFFEFLKERCGILSVLESDRNLVKHKSQVQVHASVQNKHCICCNKNDHQIYSCEEFLKLDPVTRLNKVRGLKVCINCLKKGHFVKDCEFGSCRTCAKKHNTLLHMDNFVTPMSRQINAVAHQPDDPQNEVAIPSLNLCTNVIQNCLTLLPTAVVHILSSDKSPIRCRALLDSGSQSSFITVGLHQRLNLRYKKTSVPIIGIQSIQSANVTKLVYAELKSTQSAFQVTLPFLVMDKITDQLPLCDVNISDIKLPQNISLADPEFYIPGDIDVLLGANIFYELLLPSQIRLGKNLPILQESHLGWIVSGCFINNPKNNRQICKLTRMDVQDQLSLFWEIEEIPSSQITKFSTEELECEQHFLLTTQREDDGRFNVRLPFRDNLSELGESQEIALKRFKGIERKLERNPELKFHYSKFISEYIQLNHMTPLQSDTTSDFKVYLPHHSVLKEDSLTTKVRIVFDGSCKTSTNVSLNDVLKVGPTIQHDLFRILIRFRKHNIAFTADIEKMYRQINIHKDDRKFQNIFWRFDSTKEIQEYQLNTITYGLGPSSYLATRCLKQLAVENQMLLPDASRIIDEDFYMDDLISGTDDINDAKCLVSDIITIMTSAQFPLRQWISNRPELLNELNLQSSSTPFMVKNNASTKTLGIWWLPCDDVFTFCTTKSENVIFTKRSLLSTIAKIFDPLGFISPIIIVVKIILQKLWLLKLDWDDPLPPEILNLWMKFYSNINLINDIRITRRILISKPNRLEVHCFSDASEVAYGCCIYITSRNESGDVLTKLICSKSKVAPLKTLTIPRLELTAALLSAKLCKVVLEALEMKINEVFLWCDSTIALCWINHDPHKLKTFVANRVSQIRTLTSNYQWKYVPTSLNPADLVSRGVEPKSLNCSLWWDGPPFLSSHDDWPTLPSTYCDTVASLPELKTSLVVQLVPKFDHQHILNRFSSYSKLIRVTAYALRFIANCKLDLASRVLGSLTLSELNASKLTLVKLEQAFHFSTDLQLLRSNKTVTRGRLVKLSPYLDENGILRVYGRLSKSQLTFSQKHQIILPSKSTFGDLLIMYEHIKNLHAGTQFVLSTIRNDFWIISGRQAVKRCLRKCLRCFRAKPVNLEQKMADLPSARITPSRAFHTVGIDYAGPYLIKDSKFRNKKYIKSYICIFICFSSKALHIELVTDLTAAGFLNALKRFIARRGLCRHLYSDNASNFSKAYKDLKEFVKLSNHETVQRYNISDVSIVWHFIPPYAPNFGGLWERAVRSVKYHLKRVLNNNPLTYEEFYTLLCQIESILNSRPLLPLTEDVEDLEAITPAHFVIGGSLQALPEPEYPDTTAVKINRFKHLSITLQSFWKRWSKEYLHSLQQRTKWCIQHHAPNIGSLILLMEENMPPLTWKMGRILETHPGTDGLVRVVTIKTATGVTKRSVRKICLLPQELVSATDGVD